MAVENKARAVASRKIKLRVAIRVGAYTMGLMLAVPLLLPVASATETIDGCVTDLDGNPLADAPMEIENLDNSETYQFTTDQNGCFSVDSSEVSAELYNTMLVSTYGTVDIADCDIPVEYTIAARWAGSTTTYGLRAYLTGGGPPSVPSTLDLGRVSSYRSSGGAVTIKNDLGFARVQGDANPGGEFGVDVDFDLDDLQTLGVSDERQYRFQVTVDYLGYFEDDCDYQPSGALADSSASSWDEYDNADIPFDTGTVTQSLADLDAEKVIGIDMSSGDKLMKIVVRAKTWYCENLGLGGSGTCAANNGDDDPLYAEATGFYYVEQ